MGDLTQKQEEQRQACALLGLEITDWEKFAKGESKRKREMFASLLIVAGSFILLGMLLAVTIIQR